MYTTQQENSFKRIFGRELKHYDSTLFGFNLMRFESDFCPENKLSDDSSMKDIIR